MNSQQERVVLNTWSKIIPGDAAKLSSLVVLDSAVML